MKEDLLKQVRLRDYELQTIRHAFQELFLADDHLWIFGSRTNLIAKGGDIDLYVETNVKDFDEAWKLKSAFVSKLWEKLGEQRIDVVINILSDNKDAAIYKSARETGVKLI